MRVSILLFSFLALSALSLSGCGGGGTPDPNSTPTPTPTPLPSPSPTPAGMTLEQVRVLMGGDGATGVTSVRWTSLQIGQADKAALRGCPATVTSDGLPAGCVDFTLSSDGTGSAGGRTLTWRTITPDTGLVGVEMIVAPSGSQFKFVVERQASGSVKLHCYTAARNTSDTAWSLFGFGLDYIVSAS